MPTAGRGTRRCGRPAAGAAAPAAGAARRAPPGRPTPARPARRVSGAHHAAARVRAAGAARAGRPLVTARRVAGDGLPRGDLPHARYALTFPGQGSQRPGMGVPWRGTPGWAMVERAGAAVGRRPRRAATEADAETLRTPRAAQVSTLLVSPAGAGRPAGRRPARRPPVGAVAGHSLGEYTALVAAGVLTEPEDGVRVVARAGRGDAAAALARPGTMAAVLGLRRRRGGRSGVRRGARAGEGEVWPARNDNGPAHVVVCGTARRASPPRRSSPGPRAPAGCWRCRSAGPTTPR